MWFLWIVMENSLLMCFDEITSFFDFLFWQIQQRSSIWRELSADDFQAWMISWFKFPAFINEIFCKLNEIWWNICFLSNSNLCHCEEIRSVKLSYVKSIGSNVFEGCKNLLNIKLSTYLELIRESVFSDCKYLQEIEIHKSQR